MREQTVLNWVRIRSNEMGSGQKDNGDSKTDDGADGR